MSSFVREMFKSKPKSAKELAAGVSDALEQLSKRKDQRSIDKCYEEISKGLLQAKLVLYGDGEGQTGVDAEMAGKICNEFLAADIVPRLLLHLKSLEFECRKDVNAIFTAMLRRVGSPMVSRLLEDWWDIVMGLVQGMQTPETALVCGSMLRESIRHDKVAQRLLESKAWAPMFELVESCRFDLQSDALATLKELMTRHKAAVAKYLQENFALFFGQYCGLLKSLNYVARRQSLKLLSELLLDRANFHVMTRFVSDASHLKLVMNALRDKNRSIQIEAFHIFKVFVANPNKSPRVVDILWRNKDKLISFLRVFAQDKEDDDQLAADREHVLSEVQALKPAQATPAS